MSKTIAIRDQIVFQVENTAFNVIGSRFFALSESQLPAVCVMVGQADYQDNVGRIAFYDQDFVFHVYVKSTGDADKEAFDVIENLKLSLATDPQLDGLVDDSEWIRFSEPDHEEGNEEMTMVECVYRVRWSE